MAEQVNPAAVTAEGDKVALGALKTSLGVTPKLRLFQQPLVPDQATTRADLMAAEADFNGYTAGGTTVTPGTVVLGSDGDWVLPCSAAIEAATDGLAPNVIAGCWIEDTAGPNVVRVFTFQQPVSLNATSDFISNTLYLKAAGLGYCDTVS